MKADFIFIAERRRNSTLRILCAGVRDLALDQHCDFPSRSQLNSRAQTGDSGANDEKISIAGSGWHDEMVYLKPAPFYNRSPARLGHANVRAGGDSRYVRSSPNTWGQPPSAVRSSMARQKSNLPASWLLTTDG